MASADMEITTMDAHQEGTLDELASRDGIIDTAGVKRARAGRPAVGGRGVIWAELQDAFMSVNSLRTKNGLPGVPYTVKATIGHVKHTWSTYVPGVDPGVAPTDFTWLVAAPATLSAAVLRDVRRASSTPAILTALADTVRVLRAKLQGTTFGEEHEEVYRSAATEGVAMPLHPSRGLLSNSIVYEDWQRVRSYLDSYVETHETRAAAGATEDTTRPKVSPEALRLAGWGRVVLTFLMPPPEHPALAPWDAVVTSGPYRTATQDCSVDSVRLRVTPPSLSSSASPEIDPVRMVVNYDGSVCLPGSVTPLEGTPTTKRTLLWALRTRESAEDGDRLLPRRLTSNGVLERLSRGLLRDVLRGKILSVQGCQAAWTTHAFQATLAALAQDERALGLTEGSDVMTLLGKGIHSATAPSARLHFPGDHVPVSALIQTSAGDTSAHA